MPRRKLTDRHVPQPDKKYENDNVGRLITVVMRHGKKTVAERIVYTAMEELERARGGREQAMIALDQALTNVCPAVEVKSRRVGGATYQVPVEVRAVRSRALGVRWLVEEARKRSGVRTMERKLAHELLEASIGRGGAVRRREGAHKAAEANRAFSHFRV